MQITLMMSGYGLVPFTYTDALDVFQVLQSRCCAAMPRAGREPLAGAVPIAPQTT